MTGDLRTLARTAIGLTDLTDLSDDCTEAAIERLCARAVTPHGAVAAVCLYPRFVAQAKRLLAGTPVRIATVVNFPAGGEDTPAVVEETRRAIADGADEIDHVFSWRAFLAGRPGFAETQIARVREAAGGATLKVILETGEIRDADAIRRAAEIAIGAGAGFLKTSTGKVKVNATPEAARILLAAIRDGGRPGLGFKAAGGIRTTEDAALYLAIADEIMGPGWATPATFRFGASGLLDALIATVEGREGVVKAGY